SATRYAPATRSSSGARDSPQHSRRHIMRRIIMSLALALAVVPAHAFTVEDWLAHEVPAAEPQTAYDGDAVTLKFSSPNPAASLVPEVWTKGFNWLKE